MYSTVGAAERGDRAVLKVGEDIVDIPAGENQVKGLDIVDIIDIYSIALKKKKKSIQKWI